MGVALVERRNSFAKNKRKKVKAALYIRVSTHRQEDRDSLPFQKEETFNYAKYTLKTENVEYFVDSAKSAKNTDRPEFLRMMNRIRSGEFTHLIIWKIDRISRNVKDFAIMYEELSYYDVDLVSTTEQFDTSTAIGKAMLQIIMVFAELERNMTSERVQAIMLNRAQKGLWNGATVPIGFVWCDKTKFPVPDPDEVKVVRYIFDSYLKLGSTLRLAKKLNDEKIPTKRGGEWYAKTIRDVLRNPFYIGTYRYNLRDYSKGSYAFKDESEWIVLEDNHEAIIDKEVFEKVGRILDKNYRGSEVVRRNNTHVHIFSGKLACGHCDNPLYGGLDRKRSDGYQPSRYVCATYRAKGDVDTCSNYISDVTLGPFVINYIANLIQVQDNVNENTTIESLEKSLLRGSYFRDVLGISNESLKETLSLLRTGVVDDEFSDDVDYVVNTEKLELEALEREREKHERALSRLDDLYLYDDSGISKKDYLLKKNEIMNKLDEVVNRIEDVRDKNTDVDTQVFVDKAQFFLITKELRNTKNIEFKDLVNLVGNELIAELVNSVVKEVVASDNRIHLIEFKNGIIHEFVYKPLPDKVNVAASYTYPKNGEYRKHFDTVLNHMKNNGPVTRVDVENLVGIKRYSALTLLNELIAMGKIERRRRSTAIKYYLVE